MMLETIDRLRYLWSSLGIPNGLDNSFSQLYIGQAITRQADMLALRDGFLLLTIITAAAIPAAIYMRKQT